MDGHGIPTASNDVTALVVGGSSSGHDDRWATPDNWMVGRGSPANSSGRPGSAKEVERPADGPADGADFPAGRTIGKRGSGRWMISDN